MAWISVSERLPEPGAEVYVAGLYARRPPYPKALLLDADNPNARYFGRWSSREWRGMVSVTHWWEEEIEAKEVVVSKAQYWLVKWGDTVRGPYDKTAGATEACVRAFGMASWNMLVKPLGSRKSAFGGNKLYELSKSSEGWRLLTEDELPDKLSRETRRSQKPRIVNGRVETEDDRRR